MEEETLSQIKTVNMSIEQTKKQEQIRTFGNKAKECRTDQQKVEFFDSFKEAFFIDSNESPYSINENIPKGLDDAFYVYANMKRLNETEFEKLKRLDWEKYPENFKIFLFDFCILNCDEYSKFFIEQNVTN